MSARELPFMCGPLAPGLERRVVAIPPRAERRYDSREWRGALVVVESGELDLKATSGSRHPMRAGAVLWLAGLPLRALANTGLDPAVLVVVSRCRTPRGDD